MVRRVILLALALQLFLPAHAVHALLADAIPALTPEAASRPAPKVCPCNGKVGCKCCGCAEDADTEPAPGKPDADSGPHGCLCCPCNVAELWAPASVYLPGARPTLRTLCEPQHESLHALPAICPSVFLPIDSPPPKDQA